MKQMVKRRDKLYNLDDTVTVDGTDWYFFKDDSRYSIVISSKAVELVNSAETLSDTSLCDNSVFASGFYSDNSSQSSDYHPVEKRISLSEQKYFDKLQKRVMRFWQRCGFVKRTGYNNRNIKHNLLYPIPTVYACLYEVYDDLESLEIRGIMVDTESPDKIDITFHLCRSGLLIGKGGSEHDKLKNELEKWFELPVNINIEEVKRT